jgi:dienelactone hydrolase
MRNVGGRLLDEGYVVVSVELRSFGDFKVDGLDHDAYISGLEKGEFVGQVVLDNVQVGEAVVNLFKDREGSTISILGHSFGGYIAIHVGALIDGISHTMTSGHFLPYACINTDFAHHGQDILSIEGVAEIYDVAGMIAPAGEFHVFFGGRDSLFTSGSRESFERLESIYEAQGAPGNATMDVNPSIGHRVDPDAVIGRLPDLPDG